MGLAVGDSLGVAKEGISELFEVKELGRSYTDDTAMMIGVAESLLACAGFDFEHMAETFLRNYEREPWRGYGYGPQMVFRIMRREGIREGLDRRCFPSGSFGNGAAMRVAPVGLFFFDDVEKLREVAYMQSKITHSHPLAAEGAAVVAYAVKLALEGEKPRFVERLSEFIREEAFRHKIEAISSLMSKKNQREWIVEHLGNGVEALNSVPTAVFSFLCTDSFEDALLYAVSLGGDADTIGAMTGAISGAYYGVAGIPERWLEKLEKREYISSLAERLYASKFPQ